MGRSVGRSGWDRTQSSSRGLLGMWLTCMVLLYNCCCGCGLRVRQGNKPPDTLVLCFASI
jgi:hypothetical protein